MVETHVLTFTHSSKGFDEWVKAYDASQPLHKFIGVTTFYRGMSKDDLSKVRAVM